MNIIDSGNTAAAIGVKLARAQVIAAYPITPQTPLTEKLSKFVESGELDAQYIPVESEHSALAVCIGASSTGARAFTATSSNGLLYMHEQVHWAAGARLPIVMCVVNRAVGAPWSIWNDHQDSMSQRDTGWIQIHAADHQQIIDTVIQAFRIAETVKIPVMVCYDGYLLSHTHTPFEIPEQQQVDKFLSSCSPSPLLEPSNPMNLNTVTMPHARPDTDGNRMPSYFEIRKNLQEDMIRAAEDIEASGKEFEKIFGRKGVSLFEPYLCNDADYIAVSAGSLSRRLMVVADMLREAGIAIGVLEIRAFRPFPSERLAGILANAKGIAVFEKAVSYGHEGPLASEIKAALQKLGSSPAVSGFILGLGGKTIKTEQLHNVLKDFCVKPPCRDLPPKWIGSEM